MNNATIVNRGSKFEEVEILEDLKLRKAQYHQNLNASIAGHA